MNESFPSFDSFLEDLPVCAGIASFSVFSCELPKCSFAPHFSFPLDHILVEFLKASGCALGVYLYKLSAAQLMSDRMDTEAWVGSVGHAVIVLQALDSNTPMSSQSDVYHFTFTHLLRSPCVRCHPCHATRRASQNQVLLEVTLAREERRQATFISHRLIGSGSKEDMLSLGLQIMN
eukprot:1642489-Amphidinium_carterae.1